MGAYVDVIDHRARASDAIARHEVTNSARQAQIRFNGAENDVNERGTARQRLLHATRSRIQKIKP